MPIRPQRIYPHRHLVIERDTIISAPRRRSTQIEIDGAGLDVPDSAWVLPGFVDSHCHLIGLGQMSERLDLSSSTNGGDVLRAVAKEASGRSPGEWILGFGWNEERWESPLGVTLGEINAAAPLNPVLLHRIDTHAAFVNSAALAEGGLSVDNEIGERGHPIVIEEMLKRIERRIPGPSPEQLLRWYRHSVRECHRFGITEVHDMTVDPGWLDSLATLADGGELRMRYHAFLEGAGEKWRVQETPGEIRPGVHVAGVKFFADGALGSRGAALLEPYADDPETDGLLLMIAGELITAAEAPLQERFALATHAIGDRANRQVLRAYEHFRSAFPEAVLRVEHAQIVHPDDRASFADHRIIPSVQSIHCESDDSMAASRLGPARCQYAYPWRSILNHEAPLLGGSDFPIESPDPLAGIRAFCNRDVVGPVANEPECLSLPHAIAAYTAWPQRGIHAPSRTGRLVTGEPADVVVLSGSPLREETEVLCTVIGGEVVYERA